MKWQLLFFAVIISALVVAVDPPQLSSGHVLYGQINNLPSGTFTLEATLGTQNVETAVSSATYGYSPTFRVTGSSGTITFTLTPAAGPPVRLAENITFQSGAISRLDFTYPTPASITPVANTTTTANVSNATTSTTTPSNESQTQSRSRRDRIRDTSTTQTQQSTSPSFCLQNWNCGPWSPCSQARQTRTCSRIDSCDAQKAANPALSLTIVPKPAESRACPQLPQGYPVAQPEYFCAIGSRRCLGNSLESCNGNSWISLESCSFGCDPMRLQCKEQEAAKPAQQQKPSLPLMYPIGGMATLILIAGLILFLLHRQKIRLEPAKGYIKESRHKGMADVQIKNKMLQAGWELKDVDKLLKK